MAVQTSQVTTAANGDLSLTPNGTGQVVVSPLGGANNQPVGVDNNGELYQFTVGDLVAAVPVGTDTLMFDDAGTARKATVQAIIDASNAASLGDLSVTTATAAGAGALAYNNGTGVFTFTPPTLGGLGGISLAALSVTTAAAGTVTGGLSYSNTTGVFTYTPVAAAAAGITLTDLSVTQATAAGAGALVYSNTTGVFTYTPPVLAGLGGIGLGSLSVTTAATGTATGGLAYNNATGVFTFTPVAAAAGGGPVAATNAEAAAGTLTTVYLSPATGIARDAAGTTGAALMPAGTTAQRPGTAVPGMTRYNSDTGSMEFYNGTTWSSIGGGGGLGNVSYFTKSNGKGLTHGLNVPPANQSIAYYWYDQSISATVTAAWRAGSYPRGGQLTVRTEIPVSITATDCRVPNIGSAGGASVQESYWEIVHA